MNSTATLDQPLVTQDHLDQFERDGFFLLENVIPDHLVEALRTDCDDAIKIIDEQRAKADPEATRLSINSQNRYFIGNSHFGWAGMSAFLYSDLMAELTKAVLGPEVYLFHEQWVVKAAEKGASFSWHQDSGYVGFKHTPYLTCWCTLDDVNEENGSVYILPRGRAGGAEVRQHKRNEQSNDLVGYTGDDPGIPVILPAGSIAVFSSTTFHRSGANTTPKPRRVYVAQYSPEPILHPEDGRVTNLAIPFVHDGKRARHMILPSGAI